MKLAPSLFSSLCFAVAVLQAADAPKPKPVAYLTEAEARAAGPDFELQGEYADAGLGAQVIALGDSKFRLVLHAGGLPGAGWDKSAKAEVEGALDGVKAVFKGGEGKPAAEVAGGLLTGKDAAGKAFKLIKVFRQSPTLGAKPPAGAKVLFDGSNADGWQNGKLDERKLLRCGTKSKDMIQSGMLHIEFFLPFKPLGRGQDRGNSGVYLQDRYEVQVLDSFGLKGENNECGGIYSKHRPAVNMCLPALTWQTYDIEFTEAQFDADGKKTKDATLTVRHNGVLIHDKAPVNSATTAAGLKEGQSPGPIQLQDHGNPIFYRNIWWLPAKKVSERPAPKSAQDANRLAAEYVASEKLDVTRHRVLPARLVKADSGKDLYWEVAYIIPETDGGEKLVRIYLNGVTTHVSGR